MNTTALRLFVACMLSLCLASSAPAAQILQTDQYNGHTYYLVGGDGPPGTGINYTDSAAFATSLGGFLVTVDDAQENLFLYDTFASAQFPGFGQVNSLYIGLNQVNTQGVYRWDSGAPVVFTSWAPGEPNNTHGREHWGTIVGSVASQFFGGPGNWNDTPNIANTGEVGANPSAPFYGIVEVVPEPASLTLMGGGAALLLVFLARVRRNARSI
jgi:Lectin C-type domain/PEP-CTERM motif